MSPKRRVLSTAVHGFAAIALAGAGEMARHHGYISATTFFFLMAAGGAAAAIWLPR